MTKPVLNIAIRNHFRNFNSESLFMSIIRHVSPVSVRIVGESQSDIIVIGPYASQTPKYHRLLRRATAPLKRKSAITIYHTGENTRHTAYLTDFSITSDLGLNKENHFRAPNWWDSVNWHQYGIRMVPSTRIRRLIEPETLLQPLGSQVLNRPLRAALITTHLNEPRSSLYRDLGNIMPVDGYGKYFDRSIANHNSSGFFKEDILANYTFSLCPENSMYPGYYTEKVPESYASGCVPITWADQNITVDFQRGSFINMADYAATGYAEAMKKILTPEELEKVISTPLLSQLPDIERYIAFIRAIVHTALG